MIKNVGYPTHFLFLTIVGNANKTYNFERNKTTRCAFIITYQLGGSQICLKINY